MRGEKKSVSDIVIEKILKDVDKEGYLPWMRPYKRYFPIAWDTVTPYRGINRLILENGEYLTMNKIRAYNKSHGTNFRGPSDMAEWDMIVFFKEDSRVVSKDEWASLETGTSYEDFVKEKGYLIGGAWRYDVQNGLIVKIRNILRYSWVCERKKIKDENGNLLPSRFDQGVVSLTLSEPKKLLQSYWEREGIKVVDGTGDVPVYNIPKDTISLNWDTVSEEAWWQIAFHESAHSTGATNRLNRELFKWRIDQDFREKSGMGKSEVYAREECIAEITSSMLCAECGIHNFDVSANSIYKNNVAYIQYWSKYIKDWGSTFIWLASEAEKAFERILGSS